MTEPDPAPTPEGADAVADRRWGQVREIAVAIARLEAAERDRAQALQRDGGDLQVLALTGNILTISYEGACGCCPHAAMGTLFAIQNILQDQYRPDILVQMA